MRWGWGSSAGPAERKKMVLSQGRFRLNNINIFFLNLKIYFNCLCGQELEGVAQRGDGITTLELLKRHLDPALGDLV